MQMRMLVPILFLSACHSEMVVCDYYDPRELTERHDYEIMLHSPVIVVGTVLSVDTIATSIPSQKQPRMLLNLARVGIQAENVLRGDVAPSRLNFDVFTYSRQNGGYSGPPLYHVTPGDRRIFFLTLHSGRLRSSGDVLDYTLHVRSGKHPSVGVPTRDMGGTIAEILLSLGVGYDAGGMAHNLPMMASISDQLSTRIKTVELLKKLVRANVDTELAARACFVLAESYYGQYGCLSEIENNATAPPHLRKEAGEMLVKQRANSIRLKELLRTYPLQAFSKAPFPDSLLRVRQELELTMEDPDPEVKRLACAALLRDFPESETACSPGVRR